MIGGEWFDKLTTNGENRVPTNGRNGLTAIPNNRIRNRGQREEDG